MAKGGSARLLNNCLAGSLITMKFSKVCTKPKEIVQMQSGYNGELSSTVYLLPPGHVVFPLVDCLFFFSLFFPPALPFCDMNLLQEFTHPFVTLLLAFPLCWCHPPPSSLLCLHSLPKLPPTPTPPPSLERNS